MHANDLPTAPTADTDPRAYGDTQLAAGHRLVRNGNEVVVLGNTQARAVAEDPARFSSGVSRFMQLPNGLDGALHTQFRSLIDAYLTPDALDPFEPAFRKAALSVVADLRDGRPAGASLRAPVDAVADIGAPFAVRAMLAWLGWPEQMEARLIEWVADNNAATRSGELARTAAVAEAFDDMIREVLEPLQSGTETATAAREALSPLLGKEDAFPAPSVTAQLVNDTSLGRPLEFEELVSILRNWTAGDLSSMAYCIGVLIHALAGNEPVRRRLQAGVSHEEFTAIADEILRQDSPFVSNRRVTTCPVTLDGVDLDEGQRVRIHWTAANRDPQAVGEPEAYAPGENGNASANLVWGAGPHACPGKYLSMLELKCFTEEFLAVFELIEVDEDAARREVFPVGGWAELPTYLKVRE